MAFIVPLSKSKLRLSISLFGVGAILRYRISTFLQHIRFQFLSAFDSL